MVIRAVLFDLDNTLFDHGSSARSGLTAFLAEFGSALTPALERSWFDIEQRNFDRFLCGAVSFQEQRRDRLREFLPLAGLPGANTYAQLDVLFGGYLRHYESAWVGFPDAAPTLQRLKDRGLALGVVTNGNHEQQGLKIKRIGLAQLLDLFCSSEQMGHAKPAASAFLLPCSSLQLHPSDVLYVGDNLRVDVEGARDAGLKAVHIDRAGGELSVSIRELGELLALDVLN